MEGGIDENPKQVGQPVLGECVVNREEWSFFEMTSKKLKWRRNSLN
ncbi:hypothetical protein A2U01_0026898 [Trifolium medium]|uniref:Uncharacterized protein n=1 Tax=Trifolium medium TaxID=97028 RepID=A0A392P293_9FABA|nr:hypothetical protein [Trifolium medium]